jgi:hypothetical protein
MTPVIGLFHPLHRAQYYTIIFLSPASVVGYASCLGLHSRPMHGRTTMEDTQQRLPHAKPRKRYRSNQPKVASHSGKWQMSRGNLAHAWPYFARMLGNPSRYWFWNPGDTRRIDVLSPSNQQLIAVRGRVDWHIQPRCVHSHLMELCL